jgi:PAS domain S-box-containing protein
MSVSILQKRIWVNACIGAAAFGIVLLFSYIVCGHAIIEVLYKSDLPMVQQLMPGKAVTPLQSYFANIDKQVLTFSVCFVVAGAVGSLLILSPLGLLFFGVSFLIASLGLFLLLDLFPKLVKPLHFDMIPYFNYRLTYIPDPVLGFRERPYHKAQITNFRGFGYSPLYGIDVGPESLRWETDEDGFRNQSNIPFADVAIIGSSFPEYGLDFEDTYPRRLEKKLGGEQVVNLAKAGYGPIEYVKAFERYALKKKPKYAVLALNAAGDIDGHLGHWTKGRMNEGLAKRQIAFSGYFPRYKIALQQTWQMLASGCWTALESGLNRVVGTRFLHPDVAVVKLPNGVIEKMVFLDRHLATSPDDRLRSPEWRALEKILVEFKAVSEQNHIVPLLLYIPGASEIYAEYSTRESGANWLRVRDSLIATSGSNEQAARSLAKKLGIELISLFPAYKEAARRGKMLYYQLDSHWNAEGREIAARVTAKALRAAGLVGETPDRRKRKGLEKDRKLDWSTQQIALDNSKSVMTRTLEGKINFWNRAAEELYGWSKEEAVGKLSHDLLRTQFPKPLGTIDAELIQTGQWQGKLVHATRDGRRVVVDSRWLLERKADSEAVVEINTPSGHS